MKLIIQGLCFFLFMGLSQAQSYQISGTVKADNDILPFANVIFSIDTNLVKGTLTDEQGQFSLDIPSGDYTLTVSYIGYDTYTREISVSANQNLDIIALAASSQQLDEVLVTDFQNEVNAGFDKKVIPITKELRRYNTNLSEILEMIPIVSMDFDGNPTIPGKSDVIVLVDGREPKIQANDLATVLRLIPSDQIIKIEIMTNPPAKYTKSNAAVINVVTNRQPQKGSIFNGWARFNDLGALGGGGNYTMKNGRFSLSTWAGRWMWRSTAENYFERTNFNSSSFYRLKEESENKYSGYGYFGGITPEFQFDEKNILSLYVGGYTWNNDNDLDRQVSLFDQAGNETDDYRRFENRINHGGGTYAGVEYFKLFDEKEKELNLELGFDVPFRDIAHTSEVIGDNPFFQEYTEYEIGWNLELEAEYFDPLDSTSSLNFDLEVQQELPFDVEAEYVAGISESETQRDDNLSYLNTLQQFREEFSVTYSKRFNSLGVNLDLGQEYLKYDFLFDQTHLVERDYFFLVPKVSMNYSFDKKGELALIYKYGARAPNRYHLNPNVQVSSDGLSESFGNPDLDPERSHEVELNYGFYIGKFNIGATSFWRYSNNASSNFIFVNSEGVQQSTYANNGQFSRLGGELSLSGSIKKFMKINLNASVFDSRILFDDDRSQNTLSYDFGANLTFFLPADFMVNLSGSYEGPELQIQGERSGYYSARGSIRKSFMKGKFNASLQFSDLFRSLETETTVVGSGFEALERHIRMPAYIGVGLNLRLGELKDLPKSSRAREQSQG